MSRARNTRHILDAQVPDEDQLFLDHVGHFVAEPAAAREAAAAYGFNPTPITIHTAVEPDGSRAPTGTANFCMMLQNGYIEALFAVCDTPLSRELKAALSRHVGVHLFAVSATDAQAHHARLSEMGVAMRPLSQMRRHTSISTSEARFTVARLKEGAMEEGRFQIVTHHTPELVWNGDLTQHENGCLALLDVVLRVADSASTLSRLSRFLGREPQAFSGRHCLGLNRGAFVVVGNSETENWAQCDASPPVAVAYGIAVRSLEALSALLARRKLPFAVHRQSILAPFPPELGIGSWHFVEDRDDLPWRRGERVER